MNHSRTLKCIEMLEHAQNLDMRLFQYAKKGVLAETVEELHACGNTACFAGYLAISKFFHEDGGYRTYGGNLCFKGLTSVSALAAYLDIPATYASSIMYGDCSSVLGEEHYSSYYGKMWKDVKKEDVIAKLKSLMIYDVQYERSSL